MFGRKKEGEFSMKCRILTLEGKVNILEASAAFPEDMVSLEKRLKRLECDHPIKSAVIEEAPGGADKICGDCRKYLVFYSGPFNDALRMFYKEKADYYEALLAKHSAKDSS